MNLGGDKDCLQTLPVPRHSSMSSVRKSPWLQVTLPTYMIPPFYHVCVCMHACMYITQAIWKGGLLWLMALVHSSVLLLKLLVRQCGGFQKIANHPLKARNQSCGGIQSRALSYTPDVYFLQLGSIS